MTPAATTAPLAISPQQTCSAVGSMSMCVAMLIAAEFMPVSLLTPIASDLGASNISDMLAFLAVARERSFTKAAAKPGTS